MAKTHLVLVVASLLIATPALARSHEHAAAQSTVTSSAANRVVVRPLSTKRSKATKPRTTLRAQTQPTAPRTARGQNADAAMDSDDGLDSDDGTVSEGEYIPKPAIIFWLLREFDPKYDPKLRT